jgi:4-carboxymuconolactone decarboxylase
VARLPFLNTRGMVPPEALPAFDAIMDGRGTVSMPISLLMHAPEAAQRATHLGTYLRFESSLPPDILEAAIITTARAFDCEFVWAAHVPAALREGVPQQVIDAVGSGAETRTLPAQYAAVVDFSRGLVSRHQVSQATFDAVRARFGERGLIDLTALIGYYLLMACTLIAADVEVPEGRPRFPERAAAGSA